MIGDVITDADREYKRNLNTYIQENNLNADIYAPGFRSDIADILAASDCVIVPSYEGLGLAAMEAMCARTRVVALDSGGSEELLRASDCGELYPSNGSEIDIADAVLRVIEQPGRRLDNGYTFCKQHNHGNYSKSLHGMFDCIK